MKSKLFSLTWYDGFKAAITAAFTAGGTALLQFLNVGHIPTWEEGKVILIASAAAFLGYLLKNVFSNSDGKFAAAETKASGDPNVVK